jgi:hypothetical protein
LHNSKLLPAVVAALRPTFNIHGIVFLLIILAGTAWARDEFEGLQCGADIPKALVGKRDANERVEATEQRHKDLGLKNLGDSDITDDMFLASWQICGHEYELLVKNGLIRDVLQFPAHSAAAPMFIGACSAGGKEIPGTIVAVLNNSAGYKAKDEKQAKTALKATAAWKIDVSKSKFVQQPIDALGCPLGGIVTQDGGP